MSHFVTPRSRLLLSVSLAALGLAPALRAQNITGEIDGKVQDASGALIPGASIVITNLDTRLAKTVSANSHGAYTAPFLAVGNYSLSVTAPGFEKTDIPIVSVDVGETETSNVTLRAGSAGETVTINANEVAPNTETPENSAVITETQLRELALNTRNFEQILAIQPGVSYTGPDQLSSGLISAGGATNPHSLSVNGLQPTQLAFNFDGADTLDRVTIAQSVLFPSIDAVQQIKVLRDSYGAQYGGGGSAQVLTVSKAGGDTFHGDAYFFLRNQLLNANSFFNLISNPVVPRQTERYDDFGGTIGGPFFIPHLYPKSRSKTFFFFSEESRRIQLAPVPTQQGNYPYVAQANGYFANPVCLPAGTVGAVTSAVINGSTVKFGCPTSPQVTNSPYPGFTWQVPQAAITTTSQQYLKDIIFPVLALQQPNSPSAIQTAVLNQKSTTNSNQEIARFDHQFSSRLSGFFRYIFDPYNMQVPNGLNQSNSFPGVNTSNVYTYGENFLGHATYTLTPNTVLDAGYSYLPYKIKSTVVGFSSQAVSPDIQVVTPFTNTTGRVPTIQINGAKWGPNGPIRTLNHTQQVFENTTKQAGQHTIQFGINYEHYYARTNQGQLNAGQFIFDQAAGGLPYTQAVATTDGINETTSFESSFAGFLTGTADSFTQESIDPVSYIASSLYETYVQDNWRARPHLTIQAGVRWSVTGQPYDKGGHLGVFQPQSYNVGMAPVVSRIGQLCIAGNTDANCNGIPLNQAYNPLNGITQGGVNSPYGASVIRTSYLNFAPRVGFAYDVFGDGKTSFRGGYGVFFDQVANTIAEQQVQGNPAYVRTTTFNTPSFAAPGQGQNASFIPSTISGSNANWKTPYTQSYSLDLQQQLAASTVMTLAYVGNKTFHLQGVEDINQPLPGEFVTGAPAFNNGAGANAAKAAILNPIRPYLGYEGINFFDTRYFADYNGLQVGIVKTFAKARGAHLVANYTWSKAMANSQGFSNGPQNTYDLSSEWGPTTSDRRNIFNTSFVYLLPFYREQRGVVGKLLGGYQVAAIITAVSGLWMTPTFTQRDPAGQGWISGVTDTVTRPDQISNPRMNAPKSISEFFNTSAFIFTPAGLDRPGNARVGTIEGPGYQVWNTTIDRDIDLPESFRLQLRLEAFNLFNHVNPSTVNTSFNGNFGIVTTARDQRQMQVGIKLYF